MRRSLYFSTLTLVAGGISACASLAGLDQITERNCAPNCGEDAGTNEPGQDASLPPPPSAGGDAAVDGSAAHDGGRDQSSPDANTSDQGIPESDGGGAVPESGTQESSVPDGALDAAPGDGSEGPDAPPGADAGADADGGCRTLFYQESFDHGQQGWTLSGTDWSVASTCANPPAPQMGFADPTVDHTTGKTGGVLGVYVCGNNPMGATVAQSYATSPVIDTSSATTPVTLTFYRWLNTDRSTWMISTIDVYDGTLWQNVYTNASTALVQDTAWTAESYDVTAYKNAKFQVRFGYAVVDAGAYSMSCWNVDDLTISETGCH